ncbi:MAG TPA: phosphoglycerate kinase, partial [Gemmatimonadaceae bacterium]|nr:phosphoglycerate kinase [Gemmatimonadaceae bacterium]
MKKKTVGELSPAQLEGKRALVRVDFNVPLDDAGHITDDTRIRAALPTLQLLRERGARLVLMSHLGRPKGKPEEKYSLAPVAHRLGELLDVRVELVPTTDLGAAVDATQAMDRDGVIMLENTRFLPGEEKNDDA